MKITMSLIIFLLNSFSFANNPIYDLKMELSLNENHLSPRIIVKEGEKASITQDSNGQKIFIDLLTIKKINNNSALLMEFAIGTINQSGERHIISSPRIVTIENQKAEIMQNNDEKKESLSLSIIATRKIM